MVNIYRKAMFGYLFLISIVFTLVQAVSIEEEAKLHFDDLMQQLEEHNISSVQAILFQKILSLTGKHEDELNRAFIMYKHLYKQEQCQYGDDMSRTPWPISNPSHEFRVPLITLMVNQQDEQGKTLLHFAAENILYKMTELLIFLGADPGVETQDGDTPLHTLIKRVIEESAMITDIKSEAAFAGRMRDAKRVLRALIFLRNKQIDHELLKVNNASKKNVRWMLNNIRPKERSEKLKQFLKFDDENYWSYENIDDKYAKIDELNHFIQQMKQLCYPEYE